ncbi:MAG: RNA 2',3'-cyclic phosphodiesterase [Shewanella sp.]
MQQRLFLGFAPSTIQRGYLNELQQQMRCQLNSEANAVDVSNLHLTLCFLGQVNDEQRIALINAMDRLTKPKCHIQLNQLDLWPNAQVCCLKSHDIELQLAQLAKQTQDIANQLQLHKSEHRFCPHISLFRKAKKWENEEDILLKNKNFNALELTPDSLHLYHSNSTAAGIEYQILYSWTLT